MGNNLSKFIHDLRAPRFSPAPGVEQLKGSCAGSPSRVPPAPGAAGGISSGIGRAAGLLLGFLLALPLPLVGGSAREAGSPPGEEQQAPALKSLTLGLMPAVNSIPLLVAQHLGYFQEEGLRVTLELFTNQMYRETALQTETIDGSVSDLINAISAVQQGFPLSVTSTTQGRFALVTSPASDITTLEEWNAHPGPIDTGLLEQSIIYYVTEAMLSQSGGNTQTINLVSVLQMPLRIEMLLAGKLQAACFPEPLTRIVTAAGGHIITETTVLDQTPGVLLFTQRAIQEKPAEINAFYRAYNRAVQALTENPQAYTDIIIQGLGFPAPTRESIQLPDFTQAQPPSPETYQSVLDWMQSKGLLTDPPVYSQVIDTRFVQED